MMGDHTITNLFLKQQSFSLPTIHRNTVFSNTPLQLLELDTWAKGK